MSTSRIYGSCRLKAQANVYKTSCWRIMPHAVDLSHTVMSTTRVVVDLRDQVMSTNPDVDLIQKEMSTRDCVDVGDQLMFTSLVVVDSRDTLKSTNQENLMMST